MNLMLAEITLKPTMFYEQLSREFKYRMRLIPKPLLSAGKKALEKLLERLVRIIAGKILIS